MVYTFTYTKMIIHCCKWGEIHILTEAKWVTSSSSLTLDPLRMNKGWKCMHSFAPQYKVGIVRP